MKLDLGFNGVAQTLVQEEDGVLHMQDVMDVSPILDNNQRLRSEGYNRKAEMRPIASIPITEYQNWRKDWATNHSDKWTWQTFLMAKIRDRDYSKFRTSDVRL